MAANKQYLTRYGEYGMKFAKSTPDEYCLFEVVDRGHNKISLKSNLPRFLNVIDYSSSGKGLIGAIASIQGHAFDFGLQKLDNGAGAEEKFYLTVSGLSSQGGGTYYMTDRDQWDVIWNQGSTIKGDAIVAASYAAPAFVMTISPGLVSRSITDPVYLIADAQVVAGSPRIYVNTLYNNASSGTATQSTTFTYTKSKSGTWNNMEGYEVSTKINFKTGIPFLMEGGVEVSVANKGEFSWGGSEGTEESIALAVSAEVPALSKRRVTLTVKQSSLTVRFTYKESLAYANGVTEVRNGSGVYHNVESWEAHTVVEEVTPL